MPFPEANSVRFERHLELKELADFVGQKYHTTRRRLYEFGGYQQSNPTVNRQRPSIPLSVAIAFKKWLTATPKGRKKIGCPYCPHCNGRAA
jgi:hypothetical protein